MHTTPVLVETRDSTEISISFWTVSFISHFHGQITHSMFTLNVLHCSFSRFAVTLIIPAVKIIVIRLILLAKVIF